MVSNTVTPDLSQPISQADEELLSEKLKIFFDGKSSEWFAEYQKVAAANPEGTVFYILIYCFRC